MNRIQMKWASRKGNCKNCPLWRPERGIKPKFGYGDPKSKVAVVGLCPNEKLDPLTEFEPSEYIVPNHDVETYWYWAAAAWDEWEVHKVMKALLSGLELSPWNLYYTNLCACSFDKATKEEQNEGMRRCSAYLEEQMQRLNPRLVVAFGKNAAKALTGEDLQDFAGKHGSTFEGEIVPKVLVFLHWSHGEENMAHTDFSSESYLENISRIFKNELQTIQ